MSSTTAELLQRLNQITLTDAPAAERVERLRAEEHLHRLASKQYQPDLALSDAFKNFFLETVELAAAAHRPKIHTPLAEYYGLFIPRITQGFQSLCAAEQLAIHGYPHQASTLLRSIFGNLLLIAAALQNVTDFYRLEGIVPGESFDKCSIRKLRRDTELEVRRKMTGINSNLSQPARDELAEWERLFDFEIHDPQLSFATAVKHMTNRERLPVLPKFEDKQFATFLDHFYQTCWLQHRLTPTLQLPEAPLPEPWRDKWHLLDTAFAGEVQAPRRRHRQTPANAIVELVNHKFPFTAASTFPRQQPPHVAD